MLSVWRSVAARFGHCRDPIILYKNTLFSLFLGLSRIHCVCEIARARERETIVRTTFLSMNRWRVNKKSRKKKNYDLRWIIHCASLHLRRAVSRISC